MFLDPPLKTDPVNSTFLFGTIRTLSFGADTPEFAHARTAVICISLGVMQRMVALLLVIGVAAIAQEDPVLLRERAIGLIGMGKYAESEPLLTRALDLRERQAGAEDLSL